MCCLLHKRGCTRVVEGRAAAIPLADNASVTAGDLAFAENGDLAGIFGGFAAAVGASDYGEDGKRRKGRSGDKDPLSVGAHVRGIYEVTFASVLQQVVGHHAFQDFVVLKTQTNPKAFGARAAGEGFAGEGLRVAEFAYEIDALDVGELDGDDVAGGVE